MNSLGSTYIRYDATYTSAIGTYDIFYHFYTSHRTLIKSLTDFKKRYLISKY